MKKSKTILYLNDSRDTLKMVRETLCIAQTAISRDVMSGVHWSESVTKRLQRMIDEIDRQRPLGTDGKHDDLHTETCGCPDMGD